MIKVEEKGLYGNYVMGHAQQKRVGDGLSAISSSPAELMADSPAFTGKANLSFWTRLKKKLIPSGKPLNDIQKEFLALFPKKEGKLYNSMKNASEFIKGEMGGIVITAVGTGLVAPFPIAFNPFVKAKPGATQEEKDEVRRTKAYSAWRQPLSAVLALLIQAGVQKPIDKFLQNLTNDKETAAKWGDWVLNQTSLNDEKYLARKVEKEFKSGAYKLENGNILDMLHDGKVIGSADSLEDAVSKVQKMRTEAQLGEIAKTLEADGVIKMGDFNIRNSATANVVNDNIDKYIETMESMRKNEHQLLSHSKRAQELVNNESELVKLLGKDSLKDLPREVGTDGIERIKPEALKAHLQKLKETASNKEVKQIIEEILNKSDYVMESRCERTLERIGSVKEACKGNFSMGKYFEYLQKQDKMLTDRIDILKNIKIENIEKATPEQIKAAINKIPEALIYDKSDKELHKVLKRDGMFMSDIKALKERIYKDVAKTYKEFTANKFGIFKQLTKVGVGVLITLPITCTALNWIYPRFMEKFFPKLAGVKKEPVAEKVGGDK